jgi:hypothetical protein
MKYDADITLGEIYATEDSLLKDIISIQDHCVTSRSEDWADNLRFLRIRGVLNASKSMTMQQYCTLQKSEATLELKTMYVSHTAGSLPSSYRMLQRIIILSAQLRGVEKVELHPISFDAQSHMQSIMQSHSFGSTKNV